MLAQNTQVLVYCAGGYDRTGTMLACYRVDQSWRAEDTLRASRPGSIPIKS